MRLHAIHSFISSLLARSTGWLPLRVRRVGVVRSFPLGHWGQMIEIPVTCVPVGRLIVLYPTDRTDRPGWHMCVRAVNVVSCDRPPGCRTPCLCCLPPSVVEIFFFPPSLPRFVVSIPTRTHAFPLCATTILLAGSTASPTAVVGVDWLRKEVIDLLQALFLVDNNLHIPVHEMSSANRAHSKKRHNVRGPTHTRNTSPRTSTGESNQDSRSKGHPHTGVVGDQQYWCGAATSAQEGR